MRARALLAAAALAIGVLAGGCDGSNLFQGEVSTAAPEITGLVAPGSVESGSAFTVQVTGNAPDGVAFIEVRASGAATDSIRQQFDGTSAIRTVVLEIVPSIALGSQVVIDTFVEDVNARRSPIRRATVTVTAGAAAGPQN